MGVRNRCRKALLQARFAAEFNGMTTAENVEAVRKLTEDPETGLGSPLEVSDWRWVHDLAETVESNRKDIDGRIEGALENWSLERLSLTARLILEQSLAEILFSEPPTPAAVVIDEAVELTRMFDTDETARFVNGVLDTLSSGGMK